MFRRHHSSIAAPALAAALLMAACSSSGSSPTDESVAGNDATTTSAVASDETAAPTTAAVAETTTTTAPSDEGADVETIVATLADDELAGRNNGSVGSAAAREFLIETVSAFAQPVGESYEQPFTFIGRSATEEEGTNVVAIIEGTDLADEFVVVGAHYDHLEPGDCGPNPADETDDICNGATDNAAGVASAIEVVRTLTADGPPRRSIIIGLWDGEEDSLDGARAYIDAPAAPLTDTVAYVNFDIQGANLLPSLATTTVLVGAETGGPNLVASADATTSPSPLTYATLSLIFGQGRSDHAPFAAAGVPAVFFTDANTGCYHTAADDIDAVDFAKLDAQIATATRLTADLSSTDTPPVFDPEAPGVVFSDAEQLLAVVEGTGDDLALLPQDAQPVADQFRTELQAVVDAGPEAFDDAALGVLINGAIATVEALSQTECDSYTG